MYDYQILIEFDEQDGNRSAVGGTEKRCLALSPYTHYDTSLNVSTVGLQDDRRFLSMVVPHSTPIRHDMPDTTHSDRYHDTILVNLDTTDRCQPPGIQWKGSSIDPRPKANVQDRAYRSGVARMACVHDGDSQDMVTFTPAFKPPPNPKMRKMFSQTVT